MSEIKTLTKLVKDYNKNFVTVREASDRYLQTVPRVRTGIFVLDLLMGGGIPLWKYSIFHGLKSSGKSTTAYRVIGNFLRAFPTKAVILMDFEQSFDSVWALNFINTDHFSRLIVCTPPSGEVGVNMVRDFLKTNEASLIVIDSLATVIPSKMAEADAEDNFVGDQARLIAKLLRMPLEHLNRARGEESPLSILLINHVRVNLKAGAFQSPYLKPCGILQDFLASLDIRFYEGTYAKAGDTPIKVTHQFKIEKNKICGGLTKRTGEFTMYLVNTEGYQAGEIEDTQVVLEYAKRADVLIKKTNKWQVIDSERQFANQTEILEELLKDKGFYSELKDKVLRKML